MRRWTVADVMTVDVAAVDAGATYRDIAGVVSRHGVSAVPVVGPDGTVLGVVSEADLVRKVDRPALPERPRLLERRRRRIARRKTEASTAFGLMTAPAVTATPAMSIAEAARRMETAGVKRLPVVDDRGRLVGLVSRRDLLRVFLRADEEIRQDVLAEVAGALWLAPADVTVAVTGGVVTLRGELELTSQVQVALCLARAVPGVVDVVDELRPAYDDTGQIVRPAGSGKP